MTGRAEQILGNDRVSSETVGFRTSHIQPGHQQRVTSDLHVHVQPSRNTEEMPRWRHVINTHHSISAECTN